MSSLAKNTIYSFVDDYSLCCVDGIDKFSLPMLFNIGNFAGEVINGNYLFALNGNHELELFPNISFPVEVNEHDRLIIKGVDILW